MIFELTRELCALLTENLKGVELEQQGEITELRPGSLYFESAQHDIQSTKAQITVYNTVLPLRAPEEDLRWPYIVVRSVHADIHLAAAQDVERMSTATVIFYLGCHADDPAAYNNVAILAHQVLQILGALPHETLNNRFRWLKTAAIDLEQDITAPFEGATIVTEWAFAALPGTYPEAKDTWQERRKLQNRKSI